MASKRQKMREERLQRAQEQCLEQLLGVLQLCCTKVTLESTMQLLARLVASSKQLKAW
jgi:hypothetical protein